MIEQLATYVTLRGGKTLVGHCHEEGSLSLPYLAFVEAMHSYVLDRDPQGLEGNLGTGAADVARIVSEIRDRVQVDLHPSGDPEDDRYRLLQAVTNFLRNASAVKPLCIVLEDLHWSDRGTLDLLMHIARHLGAAAALLGKPEEARGYYRQAMEAGAKIGFRPEIALTRLQFDELLLDHYRDERTDSMEHADFALGEFRDMKMQPSLERALRHRETLRA